MKMRNSIFRKEKRLLILSFLSFIMFACVGYALLSKALSINGTASVTAEWDIKINSIELLQTQSSHYTQESEPTVEGGTTANFNVNLLKPGAMAKYKIVVENSGSIDAILNSISGLDGSTPDNNNEVNISIDASQNDVLASKDSKEYIVSAEWPETSTAIPSSKSVGIQLNYQQN